MATFRTFGLALIALAASSGTAFGQASLSCRVQQDLAEGGSKAPRVSELVWSQAHGEGAGPGRVVTGIGTIAAGEDLKAITLDGQPIRLPAEVAGLLRFGKAYDYRDKVVLAYRVEREWDSSATPSEVVYALNKQRVITEVDVLPGDAVEDGSHCVLIP